MINIFPDLCCLSDEIGLQELMIVCIQRYMRECVMLKPARTDQGFSTPGATQHAQQQSLGGAHAHVQQAGMVGALGGIAGAGGLPESTVNVLFNVKKLVKSLLLLCPEAYLALAPEIQAAWRLIESESSVRAIDADALKSVLRKAGTNAIVGAPNMQVLMPWSQDQVSFTCIVGLF
jgi:hypothetical protein